MASHQCLTEQRERPDTVAYAYNNSPSLSELELWSDHSPGSDAHCALVRKADTLLPTPKARHGTAMDM